MGELNVGNTVYFARVHHETGIYDLCELKIRTVYEDSFVGVDKQSKQAFLINNDDWEITVFANRSDALAVVKEAEKQKKKMEVLYE